MSHKTKVDPDARIRVRDVYALVRDRVAVGAQYGLRRATKYSPKDLANDQDFDFTAEEVTNQVMNELCDLLDFGPLDGGT